MTSRLVILFIGVLALAALIFRLAFWRAILFVKPASVRIDAEDPPGGAKVPEALQRMAAELAALGFVSLGSHSERPHFGPATLCFDFAKAEEMTFATLFESRDGAAQLYFTSLLPPSAGAGGQAHGFVITANYRRPAKELAGRYISGWLEDVPPDRMFRAHLRRVEGMTLVGAFTQDARLEIARAWVEGPGTSEVRQEHVAGLLWTVGSLGMVAAAIFGTFGSSR